MVAHETCILLDGLVFPECPRWRDGKLWFSDMHAHKVVTVDLDGNTETIVEVPGQPAGLGWLPDGRLLLVSQTDMRLLRLDPHGLVEVADLSRLARVSCNDMVVDTRGRAYVGHFGFSLDARPRSMVTAEIIIIGPEGTARVAAGGLIFPNGMVITPDRRALIVAESFGGRLTAFDIKPDGSLTGRRVWAPLPGVFPDGICLDAAGAVWVANAAANQVMRVMEGGEIDRQVNVSDRAFSCMLGGSDRRILFITTAPTINADEARTKRSGRIETIRVDVPGAGLP